MASCDSCGETLKSIETTKICTLCAVKMVNHAEGEFDDDNDPAIKYLRRGGPSKGSNQGGCVIIAIAAAAVPIVLIAVWAGIAGLAG